MRSHACEQCGLRERLRDRRLCVYCALAAAERSNALLRRRIEALEGKRAPGGRGGPAAKGQAPRTSIAHCRSCGAEIIWARSVNGVPMPLDAKPVPDGNVILEDGTARVIGGPLEVPPGTKLYSAHHATCPDAERWRGRKRPPKGGRSG